MTHSLEYDLQVALECACQAQNASVITRGRQKILAMPRPAVLQCIERVADRALTLDDEWEFRRLLELYEQLDYALLQRLVTLGLASENAEIRESAEDYRGRL